MRSPRVATVFVIWVFSRSGVVNTELGVMVGSTMLLASETVKANQSKFTGEKLGSVQLTVSPDRLAAPTLMSVPD